MRRLSLVLVLLWGSGTALAQQSTTFEQRLTRLEDIEAIRTLLHSYGRYVDARDWQAFSMLFASDGGTWDGGMGIARGRDEIIAMMEGSMPPDNVGAGGQGMDNLHLLGNEFIDVNGETATALSKWVFVMTAEEGGPDMVFVGHYEDQLVKQEGVWKFRYRKVGGDIMQELDLPGLDNE